MDKRRSDRASETTPHPRIDLRFKNDLERAVRASETVQIDPRRIEKYHNTPDHRG
jgi:hypothetical protein